MVVLQHRVVVIEQSILMPRVDKKGIRSTRMTDVVNNGGKESREDFKRREDIVESFGVEHEVSGE